MAATHQWSESNGATPTVTDGITNINFGSTDAADLTPSSYPIIAGENSFHKAIRCKFSGTFTEISNMRIWKSAGAYKTDEAIVFKVQASYIQPTATALSGASAIPVTEPSENVSPTTITVAGYTDYIHLQLQSQLTTPAGAVNQKTFTFKYDEM